MESIGIKNLRSLVDTSQILLKPITVLVGRNSSGKSSFLRTFPLLKQSIETKTSEPILWFGDYVDFGDFENSLSHVRDNNNIQFDFEFKTTLYSAKSRYRGWKTNIVSLNDKEDLVNIKVTITVGKSILEKLKIRMEDQEIVIIYNKDGYISKFLVNGENLLTNDLRVLWEGRAEGIIPELYVARNKKDNEFLVYMPNDIVDKIFAEKCTQKLMEKTYKSTKKETIKEAWNYLDIGSKMEVLTSIKNNTHFPYTLHDKIRNLSLEDSYFLQVNNLIVASHITEILMICNSLIVQEAYSVKYIKPIRFNVERYYRVQGLNIDEIDASGENIPMFIYGLNNKSRKNFEEWTEEKFGVVFTIETKEGHVSLIIKDKVSGEKLNLADVGYGYSQVLPIIVLLWNCFIRKDDDRPRYSRKRARQSKFTIVIEQPELHLHPGFQARIVDLFASIVNEAETNKWNVKIIFETHSETMINRLGYLIARKKIESKLINVLIFEKDKDNKTTVKPMKFSEKGMLSGWPIGFFTPERIR